jgi:hypothetical protein
MTIFYASITISFSLEEKGVEKPYPVGASIRQETSVVKYLNLIYIRSPQKLKKGNRLLPCDRGDNYDEGPCTPKGINAPSLFLV